MTSIKTFVNVEENTLPMPRLNAYARHA